MQYGEAIERNPAVMVGKPIIKGTCITVELVVRKMANGYSVEQLLASYPHLNREQLIGCTNYSCEEADRTL